MILRATPFHARTASANRGNCWMARNGFTLPSSYDDENEEALVARACLGMADISWHWRVVFEGARAAECLARLCTRDVAKLSPGQSARVAWLDDTGLVRGAGRVDRLGRETFCLCSTASDGEWLVRAARIFGVTVTDITEQGAGLALYGPYAEAALMVAGIEGGTSAFRKLSWRAREIEVVRDASVHEIWCPPDDALLLWDRLVAAGASFAMLPIGVRAIDILAVERGLPRMGIDFEPGSHGPAALGLADRIDAHHIGFNGRTAALAKSSTRTLAGLELDGPQPMPHTPVTQEGRVIGITLNAVYSPALRRAIALAQIDAAETIRGRRVTVAGVPATISGLPFLADPDPVAP